MASFINFIKEQIFVCLICCENTVLLRDFWLAMGENGLVQIKIINVWTLNQVGLHLGTDLSQNSTLFQNQPSVSAYSRAIISTTGNNTITHRDIARETNWSLCWEVHGPEMTSFKHHIFQRFPWPLVWQSRVMWWPLNSTGLACPLNRSLSKLRTES